MVRQGHLIVVVVAFLIGGAVLGVGCAGVRSEVPKKEQRHTEATAEQARSSEATVSEEVARCAGTRTTKLPRLSEGIFITNDLPSCPNKGGQLSGTDKSDHLAGKDGDDEIRALGGSDWLYGGAGSDVIYGGPGSEMPLFGQEGDDVIYGGPGNDKELRGAGDGQRDELYCGKGRDTYTADKLDHVDSSCEVKTRVTSAMA